MDVILAIAVASLGVLVFVLVYWAAKREQAKENGETPPSFTQTMRGLVGTLGGGPGIPPKRPPQ